MQEIQTLFPKGLIPEDLDVIEANRLIICEKASYDEAQDLIQAIKFNFDRYVGLRTQKTLNPDCETYFIATTWPTKKFPSQTFIESMAYFVKGFFSAKGWV